MSQSFGIATKALIINPEGKVLIIYKSDKDDVNPNDYDIPGGRLEFGERAEEGIQREIKEELGINIEIGKPNRIRGFVKNDLHLVGITFLAEYIGGEIKLSFEHTNYMRKTKDEIISGDFPGWLQEEIRAI